MKENIIFTIIGYLVVSVIFLPLLLIKNSFWIGIAFLLTIGCSVVIGQGLKKAYLQYKK